MYTDLYQYLLLHKQVSLPGIGILQLERSSATTDFTTRTILPASYQIRLQHDGREPDSTALFSWLAKKWGIAPRLAEQRFSEFVTDLKAKVVAGQKVEWSQVGVLTKGLAGEIKFDSALKQISLEKPVYADKVLREKAEHSVRVGEDERTSFEMEELLATRDVKRFPWWAVPLIFFVLTLGFIIWHFTDNGVDFTAAANQSVLTPADTFATSADLP